jgi:hypothetical protein
MLNQRPPSADTSSMDAADRSTEQTGVFAPRLPPAPPRPAATPLPPPTQGTVAGVPPSLMAFRAFVPPPTPPPKRGRRWGRRLVAAVIVVGSFASWGVRRYREDHPATDTTASAPVEWDARIVDLVAFVERERGLTFDHPVATHFLPEAEFVALFDVPDTTDPAAEELDQQTGDMYSALGLASGYDPSAGQETIDRVSVLGFYDPDEDALYVRGEQLTPEVSTVAVHELTHALQAQHFRWQLGGPDDLAVRSVIEADAMRIEDRYADTLPVDTTNGIDDGIDDGGFGPGVSAELDAVPWAMIESSYAPYVLGPSFLETVERLGGSTAVDSALQNPPTEAELLDPWSYVEHGAVRPAVDPQIALPPDGAEVIYRSSPFGLFDAMVMLDAWLPWQQTRRALDGWNGAAMSVWQTDGQVCNTIVIGQVDAAGAQRLAEAVTSWATASGSLATPTIATNAKGLPIVSFSPCRRPDGAQEPTAPPLSTSYELSFENSIVADAADSGTDRRLARCAARLLIDDPAFNEYLYLDELTAEQSDRLYESGNATRTWCENDPASLPDR